MKTFVSTVASVEIRNGSIWEITVTLNPSHLYLHLLHLLHGYRLRLWELVAVVHWWSPHAVRAFSSEGNIYCFNGDSSSKSCQGCRRYGIRPPSSALKLASLCRLPSSPRIDSITVLMATVLPKVARDPADMASARPPRP